MRHLLYSIALLVYSAALAFGQCQSGALSLSQELHESGAVVVGTVEAAQETPDSSTHLDGVNYTVRVDRLLRGKLVRSSEFTIFSANSAEKFPMQVGKQYLLFVHQEDDLLEVNNCGNSGLLQASSFESLQQLNQYAKESSASGR